VFGFLWTSGDNCTISPAIMTRFLLTLLALLTGLAATGTPAAARLRLADGAEIGAVAGLVEGAARVAQAPRVLPALSQPDGRFQPKPGLPEMAPSFAIPSVLPGIDRAHE
jgi:hypothetical protein